MLIYFQYKNSYFLQLQLHVYKYMVNYIKYLKHNIHIQKYYTPIAHSPCYTSFSSSIMLQQPI